MGAFSIPKQQIRIKNMKNSDNYSDFWTEENPQINNIEVAEKVSKAFVNSLEYSLAIKLGTLIGPINFNLTD